MGGATLHAPAPARRSGFQQRPFGFDVHRWINNRDSSIDFPDVRLWTVGTSEFMHRSLAVLQTEMNPAVLLNADALERLLEQPDRIPEDWEGCRVHFPGLQLARKGDRLIALWGLCQDSGGGWGHQLRWLHDPWEERDRFALLHY